MTKRTRRNHTPPFKAKVALAALRGERAVVENGQPFSPAIRLAGESPGAA